MFGDFETKVDEDTSDIIDESKKLLSEEEEREQSIHDESIKVHEVDRLPPPETKSDTQRMLGHYAKSKLVEEDGDYCYIGLDNHRRRYCVEAHKDDVCVSGEIYKRSEDCVMPKLRF